MYARGSLREVKGRAQVTQFNGGTAGMPVPGGGWHRRGVWRCASHLLVGVNLLRAWLCSGPHLLLHASMCVLNQSVLIKC